MSGPSTSSADRVYGPARLRVGALYGALTAIAMAIALLSSSVIVVIAALLAVPILLLVAVLALRQQVTIRGDKISVCNGRRCVLFELNDVRVHSETVRNGWGSSAYILRFRDSVGRESAVAQGHLVASKHRQDLREHLTELGVVVRTRRSPSS